MSNDSYIDSEYSYENSDNNTSIEKIFEVLKNMPNEDFQKLVYLTTSKICTMIEKDYFNMPDSKKKLYISMAQTSALKTFNSNINRVKDTFLSVNSSYAPDQLKDIVNIQLLFDVVYNDFFDRYMNAKDKNEFFESNDSQILNFAIDKISSNTSKEFIGKLEENKKDILEHNNIKNAVVQFWVGYVKQKYPNLSIQDQNRFCDRLMFYINKEYDSYIGSYLNVEYEPCDQLRDAFEQINLDGNNYEIFGVFPNKTSTATCKGKFAKAIDETGIPKYLYITSSHFSALKDIVEKEIESEEAKIPSDIMKNLEEEHQKDIIKAEEKRKVKQKVEELYETLEALKQKLEDMLGSYSDEIDKIDKLPLTDKEKYEKKQQVIKKIQKLIDQINNEDDIKVIRQFKYSLDLYGDFIKKVEKNFEHNKVSHAGLYSGLYGLYREREALEEYKENNLLTDINENMSSDPDLTILIEYISHAYADACLNDIFFSVYQSTEDLYMRIKAYLQMNSSKILDKNFIRKFLNNELIHIFPRKFDNNKIDSIYIDKGIVYRSEFSCKKVYYGEETAVKKYINKIDSKIRFYTDTNNKAMLDSLKRDKRVLEDYLQNISKNIDSQIEPDEVSEIKTNSTFYM